MSEGRHVEDFVRDVRRRLNHQLWWHTLAACCTGGAAVLVAVGAPYLWYGYRVPIGWYALVGILTVAVAATVWWLRRYTVEDAARFVDERFGLQDGVASCQGFYRAGREEGLYALQAADTAQRVGGVERRSIRRPTPLRTIVAAVGLVALATAMGFKPPSDAVVEQRAMAARTEKRTKQLNEGVEDAVQETAREVSESEEKLLEPNKLRKWVEKLKATGDRKEALRQYAKLEQKLRNKSDRLGRKRDEQVLDQVAAELKKVPESKRLGEKLENEEYEKASEGLEELKQNTEKDLEARRKQLDRLKATAQRMAKGARQAEQSGADQSPSATSRISQKMEKLKEDVSTLDQAMGVCERQMQQRGKCKAKSMAKCNAAAKRTNKRLGQLAEALRKLGTRKKAQKRLTGLCRKLGACQSTLLGRTPGGKRAGRGTDESRRDESGPEPKGKTTQVKGTKNTGPALTKVEAAAKGSGTSSRRGGKGGDRKFRREVEAFVEREDVPASVRGGVKAYFENIQRSAERATK